MSAAPVLSNAEVAGTSSVKGSAWIAARASERAVTQQQIAADPKFKKYTQQVDKCLNSFENIHEWADCIAFLKQLLKTLQSYTQFKEIPRKLIVAKRLSQCLNPALPTGVHQRALDVYLHILSVLGKDGLQYDLAIWSPGLFPFFEYAATSVKPVLLNLFDSHYLPLQAALRPVMKSFILALLPGLEEETSEFFEKVLHLLDRLSGTISPSFFFQNIWLVMLTNSAARGTSLNYLARRLPQMKPDEDITEVVGKDIGLMIRAFSAALEDENLLVRRSALDILLQSLKLDSTAIRRAQSEDRAILMRAAAGVVLRRDLSLNRRLYSWLLGTDEKSDKQIEHFRQYGLELLADTLKNEMFTPSGEYSESRPFKIFISLLDKWEIGAPLTSAIIYESFKAVQTLLQNPSEGTIDVNTTASTLYEAVEPQILWKKMLSSAFPELDGSRPGVEAIQLISFLLKTFVQDEEMQTIHLPIVFAALCELVLAHIILDGTKVTSPAISQTLLLLEELYQQIPPSALWRRPSLTNPDAPTDAERPLVYACSVYGLPVPEVLQLSQTASDAVIPFVSGFQDLSSLVMEFTHKLLGGGFDVLTLRQNLSQTLLLLNLLTERLGTPVQIKWDPDHWIQIALQGLEHESATFVTVDRTVSLAIALGQSQYLDPKPVLDNRQVMLKMTRKLLQYLRPEAVAYHVRAVDLIWLLQAATPQPHIESIVAQTLTSPESRDCHAAYDAFGVLWRLTEDVLRPGFKLKVPMMIVLDTLKNDEPILRRIGETWMRCSLKSYLRVLDPIIFDLLDPAIVRVPTIAKVEGREIQIFNFSQPFDQRYVHHLLELLLCIIRFGGQGFAKTARTALLRRSNHPPLVKRAETCGYLEKDATYLDALVEIVLRFVQSEPTTKVASILEPDNMAIQSSGIDLLQAVVARGDVDGMTEQIEAIVIGKLFLCVHWKRLNLQNKLLHLLHSLISSSIAQEQASRRDANNSGPDSATGHDDQTLSNYTVNPLLIQVLIDGIVSPSNRPVLQHWLDFILMAIPQLQPALQPAVAPLNDCLCRQLSFATSEVLRISRSSDEDGGDSKLSVTDAELIMLLNGLERMILLSLTNITEPDNPEEEATLEKSVSEGTGILGYVSNVFASDSSQQVADDQLTSRSPAFKALNDGIRVLFSVWALLDWSDPVRPTSKDDSLSMIYSRVRLRCRKVLEHLFRVQSAEVFESIVDCWNNTNISSKLSPTSAFELVDTLVSSAQSIVHIICESISSRITGTSEKHKRQAMNPNVNEVVLFKFMEQYLNRLEGPIAIQCWGRYLQLVREIITGPKDFRVQHYLALSCLTTLAEKVVHTAAMDDRRVRKELQDTFSRLLDTCVTYIGRSSDHSSWLRRSTKDSLLASGRNSPAPPPKDSPEKGDGDSVVEPPAKLSASVEMLTQITNFLAKRGVPNLRKFLLDNDKIISACNNITYYVVNPSMRGKTRPMEVDPTVIGIIQEMVKIPAALKAWRNPVTDLLNDNRVFNCPTELAQRWKPITKALFDADKAAFTELLSKVATAPSANIFTNREYEMLLRSLNVRRLSFALLAGDKNHFLTQLPTIQEKLVDILKNVNSPLVQSEVFLCVRVLLCRLSPHNLTSFWPVLLTELYRILEQTMVTLPADGSEDLQLILAACKCLDLLLVLQTLEFQIHQWVFVTDTVDAIYRPDNWFPEAMMDQLSEIVGALPVDSSKNTVNGQQHLSSDPGHSSLRRPLLNSIRQIESIRDLASFFSHVSIASYESVYASAGNVDWDSVENGILDDMFDGR